MKNESSQRIYLQFRCKDGEVGASGTASMALLGWYDRFALGLQSEDGPPVDGPPVEVRFSRQPMTDPLFLLLFLAGLERTFGEAPELPRHLLEPEHYKRLAPLADSGDLPEHLRKGTPEVVEYEQVCLSILNWLRERGEITELLVNEPIKPADWYT
jgi:hypothetical protein